MQKTRIHRRTFTRDLRTTITGIGVMLASLLLSASVGVGAQTNTPLPHMFDPRSTPADGIYRISRFVLSITGIIFVVVVFLLVYAVVKFSQRAGDEDEPPQVYGSNQVELAWTVLPVLVVLILFLATARVIHSIQRTAKPAGAIEVVAIGQDR